MTNAFRCLIQTRCGRSIILGEAQADRSFAHHFAHNVMTSSSGAPWLSHMRVEVRRVAAAAMTKVVHTG